MHMLAYVLLPPGVDDVTEAVTKIMEPYSEDVSNEGWWDWWQVGGRWTGHFDGYDPDDDPTQWETCDQCHGTGTRDWSGLDVTQAWIDECNGCNGCRGKGYHTKWTTDPHDGDVMAAPIVLALMESDPDKYRPYTMVVGERVHHSKVHNPDWDEQARDYSTYMVNVENHADEVIDALRQAPAECLVAIVDYHS